MAIALIQASFAVQETTVIVKPANMDQHFQEFQSLQKMDSVITTKEAIATLDQYQKTSCSTQLFIGGTGSF